MTRKAIAAIMLSLSFPLSAFAVEAPATVSQSATQMSEGEVRKIDKDAGKVTIKHGPIRNLDMPGMTMVFRVKDPAMLDRMKAGDKIMFSAGNIGGAFTVTGVEPAK
jgi:Cu/Ag efflux protein CusF